VFSCPPLTQKHHVVTITHKINNRSTNRQYRNCRSPASHRNGSSRLLISLCSFSNDPFNYNSVSYILACQELTSSTAPVGEALGTPGIVFSCDRGSKVGVQKIISGRERTLLENDTVYDRHKRALVAIRPSFHSRRCTP
jgi:hypothetical protein